MAKILVIMLVAISAIAWLAFETFLLFTFWHSIVKEAQLTVILIYVVSLLGVTGLILSTSVPRKIRYLERFLKIIRGYSFIFFVATFWVPIFFVVRKAARNYVRFLAFNITDSYVFPDCSSCLKFDWDADLQFATYASYATLMVIYTGIIAKLFKSNAPAYFKRTIFLIYLLSFPTFTSWGVHSSCAGFGGCSVGYTVDIVAPLILSTQPLLMILTAFLVLLSSWIYVRITNARF